MLEQARCGIGGHQFAMACSGACRSESRPRGIAAQLPRARGGRSDRRHRRPVVPPLRLRPELDRQPLGEIVGERYAKVSSPESIQLPAGQESRRRTDPARRGRSCAADPASDADDHRAGQPLLRPCGDRSHRVQAGRAPAQPRGRERPQLGRCRRKSAKGCAKSPIPSFAHAWSRLPRKLPLAAARLRCPRRATTRYPLINRSD